MAEFDVFVSYCHNDAGHVLPLVDAMRETGLTVWIDQAEISDFDGITARIRQGLGQSKVLLAWYSVGYPLSRACQWELTTAYLAAQRQGLDPRSRVLVINPEASNHHIHPVQLRDASYLQPSSAPNGFAMVLAQRVAQHVSRLSEFPFTGSVVQQSQWYNAHPLGSNRFVGRIPDMWSIHSALWRSECAIITGAFVGSLAQVNGLGGIGKSLLAEEYALRFAGAYPGGVFGLRVFGYDDVRERLTSDEREADRLARIRAFAIGLGIPGSEGNANEIEYALVRALEQRPPFLWVVDDFPSGLTRAEIERWVAPCPNGKTLMTTRSREYDATGILVALDRLGSEEAFALLTAGPSAGNIPGREACDSIALLLGGHPLALDVARAAFQYYKGAHEFYEALKNLLGGHPKPAINGQLKTGHHA